MNPLSIREGLVFLEELRDLLESKRKEQSASMASISEELARLEKDLLSAIGDPCQLVPDTNRFNTLRQSVLQQNKELQQVIFLRDQLVKILPLIQDLFSTGFTLDSLTTEVISGHSTTVPVTTENIVEKSIPEENSFAQLEAIVRLQGFLALTQPRQLALIAFVFAGRKQFLCKKFSPIARKLVGRKQISAELAGAATDKDPLFSRTDLPADAIIQDAYRGGNPILVFTDGRGRHLGRR